MANAADAEEMLIGLNWVKTPGLGLIFAPIGREKLKRLLTAFDLKDRFPRPGFEMLMHEQDGVKFYAVNKSGAKFEINIYGDVSRVIPQISQKAKVRVSTAKSQWTY